MNVSQVTNNFLFPPEHHSSEFNIMKHADALKKAIKQRSCRKKIEIIGGAGLVQLNRFESDETYKKNNSHLYGFSSDGIEAYFSCSIIQLTEKESLRSLYEIELDILFDDGAYMVNVIYDFRTRRGYLSNS